MGFKGDPFDWQKNTEIVLYDLYHWLCVCVLSITDLPCELPCQHHSPLTSPISSKGLYRAMILSLALYPLQYNYHKRLTPLQNLAFTRRRKLHYLIAFGDNLPHYHGRDGEISLHFHTLCTFTSNLIRLSLSHCLWMICPSYCFRVEKEFSPINPRRYFEDMMNYYTSNPLKPP